MPYVEQHASFALGNFINLTPTLRHLADKWGDPVPVLFRTPYVKQCFLDCPFIRHIEAPEGERLFGSNLVCKANTRPDFVHVYERVVGMTHPDHHTYVDRPTLYPAELAGKIVLINGSGSERVGYVEKKNVGRMPYQVAIDAHPDDVVFVGSEQDAARSPWGLEIPHSVGVIREALAVIAQARMVIANDTGFAHAAGAMNKPLLVLWKNTPYPRCKNAGLCTTYAFDRHVIAVQNFLRLP